MSDFEALMARPLRLELSEHLQERMQLYTALHPVTKQGAAPGNKGGKRGKIKPAESAPLIPSFADDTAKKTGPVTSLLEVDAATLAKVVELTARTRLKPALVVKVALRALEVELTSSRR